MAKDYLKSVLGLFDNAKELARQKAEEARRRAAEAARQRAQQAQSFVRSIPQKARDFNEVTADERNAGRNKLINMGFKPSKPAATQGIKITDAIKDTSKNVANDFGNFFRNSNFGGKRVQPVMNMVGNTAEAIGSGVSGAAMNVMNLAEKPTATNLVRQGAGLVYNVAKPIAASTPFFTAANIATQTPQGGKLDPVARISAGLLRGQTGVKTLAPDVEERKQNFFGMEFDPATAGGEMLGFVKNPVNKKLFSATEAISPKWFLRASGSPAAQQALGKIQNFLSKNAVRGSIEDIMMSLDELPEDASLQEQAKYLAEKGLWGAIAENVGQGFFKGSESVVKGASEVATKGLDKIDFKPAVEFLENINLLRKTTGETPELPTKTKGPRSAEDIIRDAQGRFSVKGAEPQMSRVEMLARDPNTNLAELSAPMRKQVNDFRFTEMGISAGGKLPGVGELVERPDGTGMEQKARSRLNQPAQAAYGFAGGIEPVYDENGKPTGEVRYNAEKGMAGFFAAGALQSKAGKNIIEEGLQALGKNAEDFKLETKTPTEAPQKYYRVVAGDAVDSVKANGLDGDAKAAYNIAQGPKEGNLNYFNTKEEALNYARANHFQDSKVALVEVDAPKTGDTTALGGTSIPKSESKITAITDLTPEKNEFGGVTGMKETQSTPVQEAPEAIIQTAREQISKIPNKPEVSWREAADKFYTQWVDRFHPIEKAAKAVEGSLKDQNASLRPENNPKYQIRRFLGVGGIAEAKFKEGVEPVLKQLDEQGIDKIDMDAYLKARRDAGFGTVGRDIKGSDPVKAQATIAAFEAKYGPEKLQAVATQLYDHQNKLFDELVDAGFMKRDVAERIRAANPDYVPFERVMDDEVLEDYLGIPTKKVVQGSKPVDKRIEGSERDIYSPIESIIANTYKYTAAVEKNKVAQSVIGLKEIMPEIGFRQASEAGPGTIPVWVDGAKQHVEVGKDIAEAAKGLNEESMNVVLKVLQWPAKILRSGATGQNPEFMLPNIGRDQFEAALFSNYGYKPFLDYFRGLGHIMRKDITGSDEVVDRWMKSGASQDLTSMSGRQSIENFFSQNKTKRKSIFGYMGDLLNFMGRYSEQPTRVGLFDRAYKATGNERLAMFESRDATLDFSRMGNKMQVANSIVPFLNVGIQGFDKLVRQIKTKPAVTMAKMGIYALAPQAAATMYNLTNFQEEYNEIDQWVKDTNIVLVKGRNEKGTVDYITFPKANSMQPFMNPLDNFLSYMAGNDTETFQRLATSLISNTLPVVEGGSTLKEVGVHTIGKLMPQAGKPLAENLINKSFFKYNSDKDEAKEIVPYYLKDKAPGDQSFKYTPAAYKAAGKLLNVSPLQIQNLAEGYFAGYAKLPVQFIDFMKKTSEGEEISPNDVSIMRRFVRETYPSGNTSVKKQQAAETPLIGQANAAENIPVAPQTALNGEKDTDIPNNETDERNWFQKMFNITPGGKDSAPQGVVIPDNDKELEVVYKEAKSTLDGYDDQMTKYKYGQYENVEQKIADLEEEKAFAEQIMAEIDSKYPEKISNMELKTYVSGAGANVDERAEWAYNSIKKLAEAGDTDKVTAFIDKLWDEKVLTSGSKGVAAKILDEYGINVYEYGKDTKTSKDPSKKSSSAASKKAATEKKKLMDAFFKNVQKQPKLGGNFQLPQTQVNWGNTSMTAPINEADAQFSTKVPTAPTQMEQFFQPKQGKTSFAEAQEVVDSVRGRTAGDSRLKLRYSR